MNSIEKNSKEIEKLQRRITALFKKNEALKNKEFKKKRVQESFVGSSYIYQKNCYSCPEKVEDYWKEYCYIIDFDRKENVYKVLEFHKDSYGYIKFEIKEAFQCSDGSPMLLGFEKQSNNLEIKDALEVYFERLNEVVREIRNE